MPYYDVSDQQGMIVLFVPFTSNHEGHLTRKPVLVLV